MSAKKWFFCARLGLLCFSLFSLGPSSGWGRGRVDMAKMNRLEQMLKSMLTQKKALEQKLHDAQGDGGAVLQIESDAELLKSRIERIKALLLKENPHYKFSDASEG